eukprot:TRINITY_DN122783_c0_g1_i1.p1 TRINITY_DN122783_c0_g1~~TRINITY_DN122783_c0_g1_i1.p1  ORF type:complete len:281 (+),score=72.18 TRINITY_DN122783_c0_g1_i1:35-877(+)
MATVKTPATSVVAQLQHALVLSMPPQRHATRRLQVQRRSWAAVAALAALGYAATSAVRDGCFVGQSITSRQPELRTGHVLHAAASSPPEIAATKADADQLAFETVKFNMLWTKMTEAKEQKSPKYEALKKQVEEQGAVVEALGGSRPAEMLSEEEAKAKVENLKSQLNVESIMSMTWEERWILAQSLGPAFPVALILSYTAYWALNVPFISYMYFTAVVPGKITMPIVMAGAYATSIPFKPLVYIAALLGTPWTSDTVMPFLGKVLSVFKLPDQDDFNRL